MVNYQNGKIYTIVSQQTDQIYIGSTTKKYLCSRLGKHKIDYQRHQEGKMNYVSSFALIEKEDCKIVLLENFPCDSKDELNAREQYYLDKYASICVNMQKAYTGLNNLEYAKKYRKDNETELKKKQAELIECSCGTSYTRCNKARHMKTEKHKQSLI